MLLDNKLTERGGWDIGLLSDFDSGLLSEAGVVGGVRSGLFTYFVQYKAYPAALDAATVAACASANACFGNVLQQGGITSAWTKASATTYTGPAGTTYTYTVATGEFK